MKNIRMLNLVKYVINEENEDFKIYDESIKNFIYSFMDNENKLASEKFKGVILSFGENERFKKIFKEALSEDYNKILSFREQMRHYSYNLLSQEDMVLFAEKIEKYIGLLIKLAEEGDLNVIANLTDLLISLIDKDKIDYAKDIILSINQIKIENSEKIIKELEKKFESQFSKEINNLILYLRDHSTPDYLIEDIQQLFDYKEISNTFLKIKIFIPQLNEEQIDKILRYSNRNSSVYTCIICEESLQEIINNHINLIKDKDKYPNLHSYFNN